MKTLLRRLAYLLRHRRHHAELQEEIESHRALRQQQLEASGLSPAKAARASRRALGNTTLSREEARAAWLAPWLEGVWQDARYGARTLGRSPSFALTSLATMVIGVTLSTMLFSTYNALLLRPWPVEHAATVVLLSTQGKEGQTSFGFTLASAAAFARSQTLAAVGAFRSNVARMSGDPDATGDITYFEYVTAGFYDALGVPMRLGRNFRAEETQDDTPAPLAIISHRFWQREFSGASDVVGRSLYVSSTDGKRRLTIIGVAREGWNGELPSRDDVWLPLSVMRDMAPGDRLFSEEDGRCCVRLVARLAPGASASRAAQELTTLLRTSEATVDPVRRVTVTGTAPIAMSWRTGAISSALLVAGTLAVMLLTGANIAHLQLARALSRQREILTRMALGAGRARVARQLVTESLLISVAAGALCVPVLHAAIPTLARVSEMPAQAWAPDARVVLYSFAVAAAMSLVFGLTPALRTTRLSLAHTAGRAATPLGRLRFNTVLLALQIALCTSVLTSAGLLARAAVHAVSADYVGFRIDGTLVATVIPEEPRGQRTANVPAFTQALEASLASASLQTALVEVPPFVGDRFATVTRPGDAPAQAQSVAIVPLSVAAFKMLGIPFVEGRPPSDRPNAAETVVNQQLARALWPGQPAIGQHLVITGEGFQNERNTFTVVGVTRDVLFGSLETRLPTLHVAPNPSVRYPSILVPSTEPAVAERLRALVSRIDPQATVIVSPLTAQIQSRIADFKGAANAAWACGALALALAAFGVFGVLAHVVETRRREIGIRLALGAEKRDVLGLLFRATRRTMLSGLAGGLLLSTGTGPLIGKYLYGLSPFDPIAFAAAAAILIVAGFAATAIPARRALGVDPVVTLAHDT